MTKWNYPLMTNNIYLEDLEEAIKLLKTDNAKLTAGPLVREFEEKWSEWLGVKHSVFVNSGSSANLLCIAYLKLLYPEGGKIIVPPLTWSSDISSIYYMGFEPLFIDIKLSTLGLDYNLVKTAILKHPDVKAIFLTHAQGFNGLDNELQKLCKEHSILLIEDVCESHGVTLDDGSKAGSKGEMSCFSYYYAHHMSTIEGGMVCTNNPKVYQYLRMLRGHGLLRESTDEQLIKEHKEKYPDLNPDFIFPIAGFNVRNNEISASIGLSQLKRIDDIVAKRQKNFEYFIERLPNWCFKDFEMRGQSNYAFNLILNQPDKDLMNTVVSTLSSNKIEFRRGSAGGGNQLRQPYVQKIINDERIDPSKLAPVADHVHFYGLYLGNYPELQKEKIDWLINILSNV